MPRIAAISIYVDDMEKAVAFYRDIIGFGIRSRPVPFITELDHEGVALVLCQAEKPSRTGYPEAAGTVIGLASTDVGSRLKELTKKKVEVVFDEPQDFPGGKFIAVRDPAGNVVELLEFSE